MSDRYGRPVHSERQQAHRARPVGLALLLGAAVAAVAPTSAGGQVPENCAPPYSPVAFARPYPDGSVLPDLDATVVSTEVSPGVAPFDSDGDGLDDQVEGGPGAVSITRGDGVVELTRTGDVVLGATGLGDIDGDGRDEFIVQVGFFSPDLGPGPDARTYLVPGAVAPGSQPVADAGISFGGTGHGLVLLEDGSGRLLDLRFPEPGATETAVLDAGAVLAVGPGGDASGVTPQLTLPGTVAATADLGGPTAALVSVDTSGFDRADLYVLEGDGPAVALTTDPEIYVPEYVGVGLVTVLTGPDGTFVRLDDTDRSGSASYLWSLSDPCTAHVDDGTDSGTDSTTPVDGDAGNSPAAQPITAAAAFTG